MERSLQTSVTTSPPLAKEVAALNPERLSDRPKPSLMLPLFFIELMLQKCNFFNSFEEIHKNSLSSEELPEWAQEQEQGPCQSRAGTAAHPHCQ